jgi:hypothetical protein
MSEEPKFDPENERGPVAWMAKNRVAANVLMLVLIVGGLVTLASGIKQEVFPEVEMDVVSTQVSYPGASPAEVEQAVILAVEEAVRGVDGVKKVTSTAMEGMGTVNVELLLGADKDRALNDVKSAIDRITMSTRPPSARWPRTADARCSAIRESPTSSSRGFVPSKSASRFPRHSYASTGSHSMKSPPASALHRSSCPVAASKRTRARCCFAPRSAATRGSNSATSF